MNEFRFYPAQVVWEITYRCNFRCIHCGTSAGAGRPDELSIEEALDLIDELHGLGCEEIHISGGEPLLRSDWPLLAERIKKHDITMCLITNGYLMNSKIAGQMKRLKFDNVCVSFDGTEKTHNHIRQNPKSWRKAVGAMRILRENDVPFSAISSISNLNIDDLDRMRTTLLDVGCTLWRIQIVTHTGRMPVELVLSMENYPVLVDKLLEYQRLPGVSIDVAENIGYYGRKGSRLRYGMPYLGCYAGLRVAGIESNGNVKGCLSMPEEFIEGNIRESSFTDIWNNPDNFSYNRQFSRESAGGDCRDCRYLHLCRGGCTTTSVSASGERANNPFCMYRVECRQGIKPKDSKTIRRMLKKFPSI